MYRTTPVPRTGFLVPYVLPDPRGCSATNEPWCRTKCSPTAFAKSPGSILSLESAPHVDTTMSRGCAPLSMQAEVMYARPPFPFILVLATRRWKSLTQLTPYSLRLQGDRATLVHWRTLLALPAVPSRRIGSLGAVGQIRLPAATPPRTILRSYGVRNK